MPITYTNRKGFTYYLCQGKTKTGKPRYYFAREQKDKALNEIPAGYEIQESVNGIVSLVKARPKLIAPDEVASIEAALKKHPKGRNYRVAVKHKQIIIYELIGPDANGIMELFSELSPFPAEYIKSRAQERLDRNGQLTPVMRFTLEDVSTRQFSGERWCYHGSIDDWIYIRHSEWIDKLAQDVIPALGTDDFFEL